MGIGPGHAHYGGLGKWVVLDNTLFNRQDSYLDVTTLLNLSLLVVLLYGFATYSLLMLLEGYYDIPRTHAAKGGMMILIHAMKTCADPLQWD